MPWLIPTLGTAKPRAQDLDAGEQAIVNQRPFLLTVGFVLILAAIAMPRLYLEPVFLFGVVLTVLTRVPSSLPALRHRRTLLNWLTPLLQFAAIAMLRVGGDDFLMGLSLIAVFPVIWISWFSHDKRWIHVLNFSATLLIVWAPLAVDIDVISPNAFLGPILVPAILCVVGIFTASVSNSIHTQQRELQAMDAELRTSADASQRQAQLLNTVIEAVPTGVLVVDGGGHDVLMNSHQRELHQLGIPETISDPREDQLLLFSSDKTTPLNAEDRPVRRAIDGSPVANQLVWIGERYPRALSVSASRMEAPDGSYAGSVIVFNDVTELMDALEAKDDFLHRVSHELRTPLTSILGYVDLALETAESEPVPADLIANLQVVERNAERLLHRVSDLLTTASRPSIHPLPADLSTVVRSSLIAAKPQAEAAGITLVDGTTQDLTGEFDPSRMHQVFDNLITNAIKYSSAGDTVTATCRSDGDYLEVCISDTGRGMTEEDRLRVFDRFFRTTEVRESTIPGLGLGLTIASAVLQGHHGTIAVESALGQGTTFTVRIPATAPIDTGR